MLGTCALIGGAPAGAEFALDHLTTLWGKRIVGVLGGGGRSPQLIGALIELYRQGRFPMDRLVSWFAPASPGRPTILYFHGNAGNLANRSERVRKFLARGWGVLFMSYRGYSGSSGSPSERANVADAKRAYELLRREGVAPEDIIVYGGVSFVQSLVRQRLVDELHLFVNPMALGRGKSVFSELDGLLKLDLKKSLGFKSGRVLLHYDLPRSAAG